MKSIKPGRGPSIQEGISSILAVIFGFIWIGFTARIGGGLFTLVGVIFVIGSIIQAIYNFRNASRKNRYSMYDIVDHDEEPDPLNMRFKQPKQSRTQYDRRKYCPFCGTEVESKYKYCPECGTRQP